VTIRSSYDAQPRREREEREREREIEREGEGKREGGRNSRGDRRKGERASMGRVMVRGKGT
jgi:hypothetical protein